ncbi:uncharacterized protein BJ212DRAFT_1301999 [Suillus subaureus]|uniref:AB hydrolase-1 domain-containing protein n=1 Tax=Suillus subaureus TaxID=48587 RepID=A0A9P7JAU0_9AGAM|nr:uncharacterized protein BJ212DRAFT_1301999 [Suillus subaureus]KAG1811492.1 hypothetical protein BJ212DRAFT_1301999 [Suillus subaureus]
MPTPMQLESLTVSDGVSYYYFDSGDIPGNTYTTLVFVPGMGFNGGVFRKLFPLAAAHPSSDADLAGLVSRTVEGQEGFLRSQAVDIATFLVMFAREQHIPPAEGTSGGIALLGWSLGSLHTHAVMAHLDALPYNVLSDLEKYLHTVVCHDVTGIFIGIPKPPSFGIEYWTEPDVEKRFKLFYEWVAGHFPHKNVTSGSIDDLEFYQSSEKPHSMHELTPGEFAELTSAKTFGASDTLLVTIQQDVLKAMTRRAIFDTAWRRSPSPTTCQIHVWWNESWCYSLGVT